MDRYTATLRVSGQWIASAVDASHDLVALCIRVFIQCDRDRQVGFDIAEIGPEIRIQFRVGGQGQIDAAKVGLDRMWTCTQRAAEFHGAAVRFGGQRYRLCIRNGNVAKLRSGFQCAFDAIHGDRAAVRVQIVGGCQGLFQFNRAEVIFYEDFLVDGYFAQGHFTAFGFDMERISRTVLKRGVAVVAVGGQLTGGTDFAECDGAAV